MTYSRGQSLARKSRLSSFKPGDGSRFLKMLKYCMTFSLYLSLPDTQLTTRMQQLLGSQVCRKKTFNSILYTLLYLFLFICRSWLSFDLCSLYMDQWKDGNFRNNCIILLPFFLFIVPVSSFIFKARVQIIIFLVLNVISSKKSIVRLTSVVALT